MDEYTAATSASNHYKPRENAFSFRTGDQTMSTLASGDENLLINQLKQKKIEITENFRPNKHEAYPSSSS